ncbi:MAG: hypothetical protein F4Y01_07380 [Gammaproteobacteria bacterium]|nr:hypothetical protein [Gammaproteobacteria bacterium]
MIFEIRNYHYEPSLLAEYRIWATELALPYIREHLDLVGFWLNVDEPPQIAGKPQDELGPATVTWIIKWPDVATRHATMGRVFGSDTWREIMAKNPGQENYHRTEAKFAEAL